MCHLLQVGPTTQYQYVAEPQTLDPRRETNQMEEEEGEADGDAAKDAAARTPGKGDGGAAAAGGQEGPADSSVDSPNRGEFF